MTLRDRRGVAVLAAAVLPLLVGFGLLGRMTVADPPAAAAPVAPVSLPRTVATPAPTDDVEVLRLRSNGRDRAVLVHEPLGGAAVRALLVVLGPHALTAARSAADLDFTSLRRQGWAVAFPSTLDGDWNAGRCCGSPQREGVDDVRFLTDARGLLLERYGLRKEALALTGYSTGGQMAYRVICEHPGYAAALLVVAGSLETDCAPRGPLPDVMVVHGDADTTVPWATRRDPLPLIDYAPTPLLQTVAALSAAAGCAGERRDTSDGRLLLGWGACARARSLTVIGMPGRGHGWDDLAGSTYAERFLPRALAA